MVLFSTEFILDKDGYSSNSDGEDDLEDHGDQCDFGGARRHSGDETELQSFIPTDKTQRRRSSKNRNPQDRLEPTRGVLTEQASRNRQARRLENARTMAGKRKSQEKAQEAQAPKRKTPQERQDARNKRKAALAQQAKEAKRPRKQPEASDSEESGDENEPMKAMILRQQAEMAKIMAENAQLKAKKKKRGSPVTARIPQGGDLPDKITKYVEENTWRETKLLANNKEVMVVCADIMANVPEFQALVKKDEVNKDENIEAFFEVYKKTVCKAINEKRSNVQSALKKAYERRVIGGDSVPTLKQLKSIIARKGLELIEPAPEDAPEDERVETAAKICEIQERRAWFKWYWICLLPAVAGKKNWGYTIRNYVTPSNGVHPTDPKKKFLTSSDEAMVLALYENCGQRFPYTAECKLAGEKADKFHPRYQSKWTNSAAGQCEFGGWNLKGRKRYKILRKGIAALKRQDFVAALEKGLLKEIQAEAGIKTGGGRKKKGRIVQDYEGEEEANCSFIGMDSGDDTDGGGSDLEDVDDEYQAPRGGTLLEEEEQEEVEEEEENGDE